MVAEPENPRPDSPPRGEAWTEYAFLYNALADMPVGVVIVAMPSGELILCNETAHDIFSQRFSHRQDMLASGLVKLCDPEGDPVPNDHRPLCRAVREGETCEGAFTITTDGRTSDLRISARPVRDHTGKPVAAMGIYRDVTERLLVETALQDYREELERRVERRTAELNETNEALRLEVARRRQAEDQLRRSEERYRGLVQKMPAIVYTSAIPPMGKTFYMSPQVEEILGYSPEDFIEDETLYPSCIYPDDKGRVEHAFNRLKEPGDRTVLEYRMMTRKSHVVWLRDEAAVVTREDGSRVVQGLATDVTERRRAEERLRASEQRFSQFMKHLPGAAYIKDTMGRILYANRFLEEKLDAELRDLIGQPEAAFWPQQLADKFARDDREVLMTGQPLERDEDIEFDGETRTYMTRKFPIFRGKGPPLLGGVSIDITERKETERQLAYQKELFQRIVDNIPVMIAFYDHDGNVNFFNRAAEETIGYITAEVQEMDLLKAVYPDPDLRRDVLEYMQNAEPGWRDIPLTTRSGEVLTTSWANVRLSDGSQIGIGIDVTDQRAAQRRIEAYQEELRELVAEVAQAEEMERRRIATALHDQMAQILALTKMRLEEASDRTEDEALAEQIEQSVRNLDKCIRSTRSLVFDLSPPVLYQVGLEAALEHLCDRMREDYDMEGCFCSDGVPLDLSEELKVVLYQAARELMVNVVKHAHAQNMDIDIETIDGELHLTIADDGVGLERVPDTAGQQGFGLFNIRERLGRFGGRLELDENPGCGSIATLIVPLDQETSAEGGNNQ